jgi:hypothetical protein
MLISVEGASKNQLEPGQESMGEAPVLSHCSLLRKLKQKPTLYGSIVVKEKQIVGSPFFGAFPSNRILKAKKDFKVRKFPSCSNTCKLYQRFPGTF